MAAGDNMPAFPGTEQNGLNNGCPGMTLRDYFAGQALAGVCANPTSGCNTSRDLAHWAYQCADMMLLQREQQPTT